MRIFWGLRLASGVLLTAGLASPSSAGSSTFTGTLSGAAETPPNASSGTGSTTVTYDPGAETLRVQVTFSGLSATTTAAHVHCCTSTPFGGTAGVAVVTPYLTGFPIGVTSGTYDHTFDLTSPSSYNPAFVTAHGGTAAGAEAALASGMLAGEAYTNIHTVNFPGGEISSFLTLNAEPVPALSLPAAGLLLVALGAAAALALRRA